MDKPIVIGVGEFLWDVLPSGKKAGGAPVNFAYHASRHGVQGWAVSAVGNDVLGLELEQAAAAHGINLLVDRVGYPTGTVQVTLNDGQPSYEICEGVAWDYIPLTAPALELAAQARAVSFGTLAQRSRVSRETTMALLNAAPSDAMKVYDINLRQNFYSRELIEASLAVADVLKINDEELVVVSELLGLGGGSDDERCRGLASDYDLDMVVLTGGEKFSAVYHGEEISYMETPKVKVVDAVGAGDAFSGAFIGSLICGSTIEDAHRNAVETAAFVCTQKGAWC